MGQEEQVMQELQGKGIAAALLRKDGVLVSSSIGFEEGAQNIIASISNITEEMMLEVADSQKEVEINIDNSFFVIVPVNNFLLCGLVKERELKKELRDAAEQLKRIL
jgi:hypothetical protein